MGNTNSRSMTYHQYYESLRTSDPSSIPGINLQGLDAYQVLGVRKDFSFDELKDAYRNVARVVHPDKGGTDQLFQLVTSCFRSLAQEYKLRMSDRSHYDLKRESESFHAQQHVGQAESSASRGGGMDNNFLDRFNRMFDENKLEEDDDTAAGYGHMMTASSKKREDIDVPRVLNKFNSETFHKTFDAVTLPKSKKVTVYREPEALPLARKIQYTELGADTQSDFSSGEGTAKKSLSYTDYMLAHTTSRLVDPRAVKERKVYKSVEQYDTDRSMVTQAPMTEDERRWIEEKERSQEIAEQKRLQRLMQRDHRIAQHHEKVNRLMLGGGGN